MITVAALVVALATVPLRGGRLSRMADLHLRWWGLAFAAVAVQVVLLSVLPASTPWGAAVAVHLASYALALGFLVPNRGVPGLRLLALGGALNLTVIAANAGVMPATTWALETAGARATGDGFDNSAYVEDAHLAPLGDVFGVPGPPPLGNVFSIGDVLLVFGGTVLLHRTCLPSRPFRRARNTILYRPPCENWGQRPVTVVHASSSAGRNRSGRVTHTA